MANAESIGCVAATMFRYLHLGKIISVFFPNPV